MGKRRAKHPFEDNPAIEGFLDWMDAPEGQQSIEALDLVFAALEHAGVDAGSARSSGPTGHGCRSSNRSRASTRGIRAWLAS
jgi:hypothetical protein